MPRSKMMVRDKEGRFVCPHCHSPISSLSHEFIEFDRWKWNHKTGKYEKMPTDSRDQCLCDCCGKPINAPVCSSLPSQDET